MDVPCATCGATISRPPSRIRNYAQQYCGSACHDAGRKRHVPVRCAVCGKAWTVKASRAAQNVAITCSPACLAVYRKQAIIRHWDSEGRRNAACGLCGKAIERKPSQLAQSETQYCDRECKRAAQHGPRPDRRTGRWVPCEACSRDVWVVPARERAHVFCSRACAARPGQQRGTRRKPAVSLACARCETTFAAPPGRVARARFCSLGCARAAFADALRRSNEERRGQSGVPWGAEQRRRVSASLRAHYETEAGQGRADAHSHRMAGEGNPQWIDGRAPRSYGRGWQAKIKRAALERDGFRCRACGKPKGTQPRSHHIHHRDGTKTNHDLDNLITLCASCHQRVHEGALVLSP